MHKIFLFLVFLVAAQCCGQPQQATLNGVNQNSSTQNKATITTQTSTTTFEVEIADTPEKRELGLMNRTSLADNAGMLFVWTEDTTGSFWMKNTYISLDILFIASNHQIIYIAQKTTPLSTELLTPPDSYRYVLEINAGLASSNNIEVGDGVDFNL